MRQSILLVVGRAIAGAVLLGGASAGQAWSAEAPTKPMTPKPPSFEEALASAKKAGKPLIVDFGAAWCEPCKVMEADLAKPPGQAVLGGVHLVRYDVDEDPGTDVAKRFKVTGYPTLMAFDAEGKEVDRQVGYGGFPALKTWLEAAPERAVTLTECLARADANRADASLQLTAGKRLAKARRSGDARRYLARAAAAAKDDKVAAEAAWALGDAEVDAQSSSVRRRHAERVAAKYPATTEGLKALRYLATAPEPPRVLVGRVVEARLAAVKGEPSGSALEELVLYGLRGGAVAAAGKAAARLEPLAGKDARRLLTVAEAAYAAGEAPRAIALAERAVAAAPAGPARAPLEKDLERFRRGDKQPGPLISGLTPDGDDLRRSEVSRQPPAWIAVASKLTRKASEDCSPADEPLGEVNLNILTGVRPDDVQVIPDRPVPAALARCLDKVTRDTGVPPEQSFNVRVNLDPPWFAQGLAVATREASDCLPASKPGDRIEPLRVLLDAVEGSPRIRMAGGKPELARCLERAFWFVRPPAGTLRAVHIFPARPRRPDDKPAEPAKSEPAVTTAAAGEVAR